MMVTLTETPTPGACPSSYTITRVWKATDACGNTGTASQVVTVADGKAPVLKAPVDVTIECGVKLNSKPKITDNCDAAVVCVELPSETISETACKKVVKRKWEATDNCGNKGTTCQTVTYMDTAPPKFAQNTINVMANCDKIPAPIVMTATDNCSTATVTLYTVNTPGKCADTYTITHTWTATDACGNSTTKQQVITVVDNNKPTLTGIDITNKIVTIECGAIAPKPNIVATDKCDTQVDISFTETPISGGTCAGNKIIRTWTATDNCSNTCSVTQCVQFKDTTPPTFINPPANATADCTNVPVAPVLTASNATDNCGQVVNVKLLSDTRVTGNCKNNYKQVRKWEASDACGNKNIHTQTITVTDTKAPVISGVPADLTLECTGVIPPVPAAGVVTATDDCTPVAVLSFKATQTTVPGTCKKTIFRTWTATDVCGNKTTKIQTIWVGSGGGTSLGLVVNNTIDDEIEAADEAPITVTPNVVLNSNVKEKNDISIFPNPTQGIIQIVSGMKKVQAFRLYNELGQAILESDDLNERDFSLELSNLNVGIYWLQLQLEGEQDNVVKRVVLMK
jgi:large repetitive protein